MTEEPPIDLRDTEGRFADAQNLNERFSRFLLNYEFAIDEIMTKISILKREFEHLHNYTPIEHIASRLKSIDSIVAKARRQDSGLESAQIVDTIRDIAGVRIVCSFISDAYWIAEMLATQADVTVVQVKDYIAEPKPNGYRSLHLIVKVPIFLSESVEHMHVEVQIRTVAMDFWASLEHKIYYKFDHAVPQTILAELTEAAHMSSLLDQRMQRIHQDVQLLDPSDS